MKSTQELNQEAIEAVRRALEAYAPEGERSVADTLAMIVAEASNELDLDSTEDGPGEADAYVCMFGAMVASFAYAANMLPGMPRDRGCGLNAQHWATLADAVEAALPADMNRAVAVGVANMFVSQPHASAAEYEERAT